MVQLATHDPAQTGRQHHSKAPAVVDARRFNLWYGDLHALRNVTLAMLPHQVTAIIGPSGCGKSTFLKSINRMVELTPKVRIQGEIRVDGADVYAPDVDPVTVRSNVGLIFQKPNPFPKSIFDNIAFGLRLRGVRDRQVLHDKVVESLQKVALWDEVKDRLHASALALSGGQQQRLCIARALVVQPHLLLMDEPASALDPISTAKLEDLVHQLKREYTIVMVTHNMQQALRVSDYTAFFLNGEVVEFGPTQRVFEDPHDVRTADYIAGRFG